MVFFSRWFCFYDDSIQTGYSQCKHVKWQYYAMKHEKAHQMREIYKLFGVFRCGRFMLALFFFWFDGVQNTPFLVSWANADFLLFLSVSMLFHWCAIFFLSGSFQSTFQFFIPGLLLSSVCRYDLCFICVHLHRMDIWNNVENPCNWCLLNPTPFDA